MTSAFLSTVDRFPETESVSSSYVEELKPPKQTKTLVDLKRKSLKDARELT